MLTPEQLHAEALTRFAALTRHKDSPANLVPPFTMGLAMNAPTDGETGMSLSFGKRYHAFAFFTSDLEMPIQEFGDKHLAGAAQALLDSKG